MLRENHRLKWWKERTKRAQDADEAALANVEAQQKQEKVGLRGGGDGGVMDRLRESNDVSGFLPIERTKGMRNQLDYWSESENGEGEQSKEDVPRKRVGEKRLLGSSSQTGLVLDEREIVIGKIWTIHAQTTSHVEEDSDVCLEEGMEAALLDGTDNATHQTDASRTNADDDDLLSRPPRQMMRRIHYPSNPAKASRRSPSVAMPHWSSPTKLR